MPRLHRPLLPLTLASSLALVLAGCGHEPGTPVAAAVPALATEQVQAGNEGNARQWDGVVEAVRHATLAAQTSGRVASIDADIGDSVANGAELIRLTSVEQQADSRNYAAALNAAQAQLVQAEASWKRIEALAPTQYVSRAQVDEARAARDAARANRDAAQAALTGIRQQAIYTQVRAPYAATVSARYVEPGETVATGQALMALYVPGEFRIEVDVPQATADAIRAHPAARIRLDDGRSIDADKVIVYPSADATTHSVTVRVMLPEDVPNLQPGITAKVAFPATQANDGALSIPASALVQRGELNGVYVVTDKRVVLRQLRLGDRVGNRLQVLSGLQPGDRVATDPVKALQAVASLRSDGKADTEQH